MAARTRARAGAKPAAKHTAVLYRLYIAALLAAFALLLLVAARENAVSVHGRDLAVRGVYGVRVPVSHITDITLIDQSMEEIGIGSRHGGLNGIGILKGNFRSDDKGDVLLYVRPDTQPTIRVQSSGCKDIYLSFRDPEKTRALYRELAAAAPL